MHYKNWYPKSAKWYPKPETRICAKNSLLKSTGPPTRKLSWLEWASTNGTNDHNDKTYKSKPKLNGQSVNVPSILPTGATALGEHPSWGHPYFSTLLPKNGNSPWLPFAEVIGVGLWVRVRVLSGCRDCDGGGGAPCVLGVYWTASFRCGHSLVMVTPANL